MFALIVVSLCSAEIDPIKEPEVAEICNPWKTKCVRVYKTHSLEQIFKDAGSWHDEVGSDGRTIKIVLDQDSYLLNRTYELYTKVMAKPRVSDENMIWEPNIYERGDKSVLIWVNIEKGLVVSIIDNRS